MGSHERAGDIGNEDFFTAASALDCTAGVYSICGCEGGKWDVTRSLVRVYFSYSFREPLALQKIYIQNTVINFCQKWPILDIKWQF